MDLRPEMMFGVVTVKKPSPVVEFAVGAHAPRNRLIRIATVMPIVAVQIRQAMAKVIERQKKTYVMPVEYTEDHKRGDERREFEDSPKCLARILTFEFLKNRLGIFAEKTQESVFEGMLGFALVTVFVNRNPIDGLTVLVRPVGVSLVVLHVNAFVEDLAKADRDRFQDAEQTIEQRRMEIRIVNEIVRDAVDVPGNADRIDETENEHHPKRHPRKKIKQAEEVSAV